MITGYSGTPLAKKMGIKPGFCIRLVNAPQNYAELFTDLPEGIIFSGDTEIKKDMIHYFAHHLQELNQDLSSLRQEIKENGMIWVSWHKKSSGIVTDVTENIIRELALTNGLVDVKVCAVSETWSGLKLVIRLQDRK